MNQATKIVESVRDRRKDSIETMWQNILAYLATLSKDRAFSHGHYTTITFRTCLGISTEKTPSSRYSREFQKTIMQDFAGRLWFAGFEVLDDVDLDDSQCIVLNIWVQ